jgi:spectinomycin phosphotransferase
VRTGQREINWIALSYYLWERVVQDVIEYAGDVCFRDDLGEETRADATHMFDENLEGSNINAAYAAEDYLPPDLTVHTSP